MRSWVRLDCGHYRVCIPAEAVVSVDRDVGARREDGSRFTDLVARWSGGTGDTAPWVIWLQAGERGVFGVAVDDIRHFNSTAPTRPFPGLGLRRPDLFDGFLEHGSAVLLVLSLAALVELTAEAR